MEEAPRSDFSEESFWDKLKRHALAAGKQVVETALTLFYTLQAPKTPKWAKGVIIGALAYFIMPVDAIPDAIPGVGYSDDLGALVAALITVQAYVTDDIRKMVREKMKEWFGGDEDGTDADSGGNN